ncbi:MAG: hypothetical protein ACYS8X_06990 [Planctomycetota bacterium]|jgi:hypothetical protein
MAHAYTPGLRVTDRATIRKERRLPIAGDVLVDSGARVVADDIVARAELPGDVETVNVVNKLAIAPGDLARFMLKAEGDTVAKDEPLAETRPFLRFLRSTVRSPIDGTIETISHVTGQILLRSAPQPVDVRAYVDGTVVDVQPNEGVVIETTGAFIQGILGIGGEVNGEIAVVVDSPDTTITPDRLTADLAGKIVVAGALITSDVYKRASEIGIAALICGGFHDRDLRALLGYDLGVAITGHEDVRPILIMTEGFGQIAMAQATFDLLAAHAGQQASANGATQIRAGVLRPEIIIPATGVEAAAAKPDEAAGPVGLTPGSPIRIIRQPGFGRLGTVKSLPSGIETVESEARARVVEIEFADGDTMTVPRANVEAIES